MAGRSARREHERRKVRDAAKRRAKWPLKVCLAVGLAFLLYVVVEAIATAIFQDSGAGNAIGLAAGGLLGLSLLADWWGPKQTTQSWRKGSDGEILTERRLQRLPKQFVCLHDRRMPGSRANI
ncbi:MAG TPA: hypothetical protein VHL54_10650, partial [Actinomycetota bacterium]|nr:hypothetical protein [Actinomycetota bacterium]